MRKNIAPLLLTLFLFFTIVACQTTSKVGSKIIGPEGGEVVSNDGVFTLIFKPGALSQEVEVIITKVITDDTAIKAPEGGDIVEYTYNKNDIAPFLNMNPMARYDTDAFLELAAGEADDIILLMGPLILSEASTGNPRLMEDNKTIVDTNEDVVKQSATLFTDQEGVLILPEGLNLLAEFSADKTTDANGLPIIDIIFTPSDLGFFLVNSIVLQSLNGNQQNTPLDMDNESGNFGITLSNLCDTSFSDPSTTGAIFQLDVVDQMTDERSLLDLEYKTDCEEQGPDTPPPPPPPMFGLSQEDIIGPYEVTGIGGQDTFGIIIGNFGGNTFTFDIQIDLNQENKSIDITQRQETTDIIITTPEDLFTLEGQLTDLEDGTFGAEAEGSGFLGDTNPTAADIIVKAEGWIFDLDEQGNVVLAEGDLRFNFPELPLNSQSSVAEVTGVKIQE